MMETGRRGFARPAALISLTFRELLLFRMFLRILVVCFWILALVLSAPAQTIRRKAKYPKPSQEPVATPSSAPVLRQNEPVGWVWVSQTIDMSKQYGGEENLFTLDGAPPPSLL